MLRLTVMRPLATTILFAAALVLPASAVASLAHPRGAGDVVIRVSTGGGFVPASAILGALPDFTLFGDGSVVVPGVVPQIAPGPAIAPLLRTHLSEHQVQALLVRARGAGLLAAGPIDYGDLGSIGIADASTTTVHLNAAGQRLERSAYALGFAGDGRIPPAQAQARLLLSRFIAGLPRGLGGARVVPRALVVYVAPFAVAQGQPAGSRMTWPLARDLATAGSASTAGYRCITVRGRDAGRLLGALGRANRATRWTMHGHAATGFSLIARPLLPDENGCASLSG